MIVLTNPILSSIPPFPIRSSSKLSIHTPSSFIIGSISAKRRCDFYDMHEDLVQYAEAWSLQKVIVKDRKKLIELDRDKSDTLIMLQHQPVYTLGTGSSKAYLKFDTNNAPFDVFRTERGGEVTYHGPGQLVMYPIINLRYHVMDLHWYLRALEEVVIRALSSTFSIEASRIEGLTGVWVGDQKLAAIGIKVTQWVAYHGLALNVTTDLMPFRRIIPCGIRDRQVGSIKGLLTEYISSSYHTKENSSYTDDYLIDRAHKSLINEFCDVFQIELDQKPIPSEASAFLKCSKSIFSPSQVSRSGGAISL